ncbi:MAG: hypothetical protein EA399_07870 [Desulfovibrionales bacterium]|nr:MAG: hypothetical protein EA399_07870 [Desulfovibrionales bacterium]
MARVYLETGSARYQMDKGRLLPVETWGQGFAHVFTTHDRDWSFGVLEVQGPLKFAEPLVRRVLRERRELTEGDRLLLYRVVRMGDRLQAVYGIISGERYNALTLVRDEHIDGMALFDAVSVVLGLLQGCRPGRARGVVVLTPGSAVVGIGDCRTCHWLVPMVVQDGRLEPVLERIRAEAAWRKLAIHGIDLVRALDDSGATVLPGDARQWPTREVLLGKDRFLSSLEALFPELPLGCNPITREERLYRPLERAEPLAWALMAMAGIMLFGVGYWQKEQAAEIETRTVALRGQLQRVSVPVQGVSSGDAPAKGLAAHPSWAELHRLSTAVGPALDRPLAGEALARLATANQGLGRISEIVITEGPDALLLRISGGLPQDRPRNSAGVPSGAQDAGAVFQRFLLGLSAQGFTVEERLLELTSDKAMFTVTAALGRDIRGRTSAGPGLEVGP